MRRTACGACGAEDTHVCGMAEYYTARRPIKTDLIRCNRCGTWFRDLNPTAPEVRTHFDVASYTSSVNEKRWWESRRKFYRYLYKLC